MPLGEEMVKSADGALVKGLLDGGWRDANKGIRRGHLLGQKS
jgi:hypothetical protein